MSVTADADEGTLEPSPTSPPLISESPTPATAATTATRAEARAVEKSTNKRKTTKKREKVYCCIALEYYKEYENLVDKLHISPRYFIFKKGFRPNSAYNMTIHVRNTGLFPRRISVTTDNKDTTVTIRDPDMYEYINTDKSLTIRVKVKNTLKETMNIRRNVFIQSYHPNIIFAIPIIVLDGTLEVSIPEKIVMPRCTVGNRSYYEFIVLNQSKKLLKIAMRNVNPEFTVAPTQPLVLESMNTAKYFVTYSCKRLQTFSGNFALRFGLSPPTIINLEFKALTMSAHLNMNVFEFGLTKFNREENRLLTICNETEHNVHVEWEFYGSQKARETSEYSQRTEQTTDRSDNNENYGWGSLISNASDMNHFVASKCFHELAFRHFHINGNRILQPYESFQFEIKFRPTQDGAPPFDDNEDPPYFQKSKATICFTDHYQCCMTQDVIVYGKIDGISVEIYPTVIDFRQVYLGEEHCALIKILNVDGLLNAKVRYKDYAEQKNGGITIQPTDGFDLEPCTRGVFTMSFFGLVAGHFSIQMRFKVENGAHYTVVIKAIGESVELRMYPTLVKFGNVPMGIPQTRYIVLMNPLAGPITLRIEPTLDGTEIPLMLQIRENEPCPINIRDPIRHQLMVREQYNDPEPPIEEKVYVTTKLPDMESIQSCESNTSVYSLKFEDECVEPISELAHQLVKSIKKTKVCEKIDASTRILAGTMQFLLNTKYFNSFLKHNKYFYMDWNAIPSDPQELYCDSEIIFLRPNSGRRINITLIPNKTGYYHRSLTLRICPAKPMTFAEKSDDDKEQNYIESEYLRSKLWLEYECLVPDIYWSNMVDLTSRTIYAGEEYEFDMKFINSSGIAGFIHFHVVPKEMSFRDGVWKFFIAPHESVTAKCSVVFCSLGIKKISGIVKVVGVMRPYHFHLLANVLPTEIRITPKYVDMRWPVLEQNRTHFYIDNRTPTNTKLTMYLKYNEFQYLTVNGGILSSTGQSMYTTLVSFFYDPDIYRNILYVNLQFEHIMEVNVTIVVEGVPLYFEPNIRLGFDAGVLFTDTKEDFISYIFHYSFPVKVINRGKRAYRIDVTKQKTYYPTMNAAACETQTITSRFEMSPKQLLIQGGETQIIEIMASSYEECISSCDFLLIVTDLKHPQGKYIIRTTATAKFIHCQLHWNPKQLTFNYQSFAPLQDTSYIKFAELINSQNLPVREVILEAVGGFRIKGRYENEFTKDVQLKLEPRERREVYVIINRAPLKQVYCKPIEGRIHIVANKRVQKSLFVRVNVLVPDVQLVEPDLVLFSMGRAFDSFVLLANMGCANAEFKWKRLDVSEQFVGKHDDPRDCVMDLLSEILRMLEYNVSCDDEPNMTLRYQKCRCQFRRITESGNLVMDILDEIINDLELQHSRFVVHMDELTTTLDDSERHSTTSFVDRTIREILDKLKLESSQRLSPASSEMCFADRSIYFYEKTGGVMQQQNSPCVVHLPHIRRSHELKATFQLTVVGGHSHQQTIRLVYLTNLIRFSKDNIYIGLKPWYETFNITTRIFNMTKYALHLAIAGLHDPKEKRLIEGYAQLNQHDTMQLNAMANENVKLNGILGFNENFSRLFGVVINRSAYSEFRVRGQGVLPILNMASPLPPCEQSQEEIIEEYRHLQRIFQYDIFKAITEMEEEPAKLVTEEEGGLLEDHKSVTDFTPLSLSEEDMSSGRQEIHDMQFYNVVKTYVLVNNNEELPNAVVLKQMVETERYLKMLRIQPELYATHKHVYQHYMKTSGARKLTTSLKNYAVQPIPCQQHGFVLDLGKVRMDNLRRFEFKLHFFGPGLLIAAIRSAVKIPGLYMDFRVDNHADKRFSYWAEKCNEPEFYKDKYRNMFERLLDLETEPRLKHAHSFDINEVLQHQRHWSGTKRWMVWEWYNSLNPSVYPDHRHHCVLAKIFTAHHSNFSDVDVHVVGFFKPQIQFYDYDQLIEDYIFIDLHMGPTLPILLRGVLHR